MDLLKSVGVDHDIAVDFLKTAAQRSDSILDAVKILIGSSGQNNNGNSQVLNGDDLKKQIKDDFNIKPNEIKNAIAQKELAFENKLQEIQTKLEELEESNA